MAHTNWRMRDAVAGALLCLLLSGLLLGCMQRVQRVSGVRTQCASNLKQIGIAIHGANDLYKRLPPVDSNYPGTEKSPQGTVLFHLLPFMEQQNVYKMHADSNEFKDGKSMRIGMLLCPSDPSTPPTFPPSNYSPNYQVFGNEAGGKQTIQGIRDGTSTTLAFSERRGTCIDGGGSWSKRDPKFGAWVKSTAVFQSEINPPDSGDNRRWHQIHPGGINVLVCDGGVFFKSATIDPEQWRRHVVIDDGLPINVE